MYNFIVSDSGKQLTSGGSRRFALILVTGHTHAPQRAVVSASHDLISSPDMELFTEKRFSHDTPAKIMTKRKRLM